MTGDSHQQIPSIVPTRNDPVRRGAAPPGRGARKSRSASGGAGLGARLLIVCSLVAAGAACYWAWQLDRDLRLAARQQAMLGQRIAELEDRLSDTDEGMSQSSAAMAVKIKELYSEVDKLWASAWRRNKSRIDSLEKSSADHSGQLATLGKTDQAYSAQLRKLAAGLEKMEEASGNLERLVNTAQANQAQLEKFADELNRARLEYARLQKRIDESEGRLNAIDAFRKRTNQKMLSLEARVGQFERPAE